MIENIIISHNDLDGIISAAICLKNINYGKVFFTSNLTFKPIFFRIVSNLQNFEKIFIFDLSIREEILKVASVLFKKIIWIDHHINDKIINFQNFEFLIDHNSKSTAELVSKYFNFYSKWIEVVNEVDSNNCKSIESKIIRDYFSYLKFKYKNLYNKYLNLLVRDILNNEPKEFIEREEIKNDVIKFEEIKNNFKTIVEENLEITELKNFKVAVIETRVNIPPYIVFENEKIKNADFIVIIYRNLKGVKIEFRSLKDFNVNRIAKYFNGGGHYKASGAYIRERLTKSQILTKIEEIL